MNLEQIKFHSDSPDVEGVQPEISLEGEWSGAWKGLLRYFHSDVPREDGSRLVIEQGTKLSAYRADIIRMVKNSKERNDEAVVNSLVEAWAVCKFYQANRVGIERIVYRVHSILSRGLQGARVEQNHSKQEVADDTASEGFGIKNEQFTNKLYSVQAGLQKYIQENQGSHYISGIEFISNSLKYIDSISISNRFITKLLEKRLDALLENISMLNSTTFVSDEDRMYWHKTLRSHCTELLGALIHTNSFIGNEVELVSKFNDLKNNADWGSFDYIASNSAA